MQTKFSPSIIDIKYNASKDEEVTRIQVDKISGHTPCVYMISVS